MRRKREQLKTPDREGISADATSPCPHPPEQPSIPAAEMWQFCPDGLSNESLRVLAARRIWRRLCRRRYRSRPQLTRVPTPINLTEITFMLRPRGRPCSIGDLVDPNSAGDGCLERSPLDRLPEAEAVTEGHVEPAPRCFHGGRPSVLLLRQWCRRMATCRTLPESWICPKPSRTGEAGIADQRGHPVDFIRMGSLDPELLRPWQ